MDTKNNMPLDNGNQYYLRISIIFSILAAVTFITLITTTGFPEGTISPDGPGYVSVTEYFKGQDVELSKWRISRPIIPILALPLSLFLDTQLSFILLNAVLFVILVVVFHFLALALLDEPLHAFYANLLLIFAFPIYYRGINVTVDLASWLIFVGTAYAILHCENRNGVTVKTFCFLACGCAIGTLITELVLASFLLVFLYYLLASFKKTSIFHLLRNLFVIGLAFTIPFLIFQVLIYLVFDYSIFDKAAKQMIWFKNNPLNLGLMGLFRILIGTFSISLLFLPMGMMKFLRHKRHAKLQFAMFVAILITLCVVYTNSIRFAFVLFPLVFTLNVRGISLLTS